MSEEQPTCFRSGFSIALSGHVPETKMPSRSMPAQTPRSGPSGGVAPHKEQPLNEPKLLCFDHCCGKQGSWSGAVLADDGNIYCVPRNSRTVLCIHTCSSTTSAFGALPGKPCKWSGGVCANDGKIYCIPEHAGDVLCIDPVERAIETFGALGSGLWKWEGGVLACDGKIYGIPHNADTVLCIDPAARTTSTFGALGRAEYKWCGGVLAGDGKIYGVPYNADTVLCIDPLSRELSFFGTVGARSYKWCGGVLAGNGKIYCIPASADAVLCIDPASRVISTFGSVTALDHGAHLYEWMWNGGILAHCEEIYGIPFNAGKVLSINVKTHSISCFGNLGEGNEKWQDGVLADDGTVYYIPSFAASVLSIRRRPADKSEEARTQALIVQLENMKLRARAAETQLQAAEIRLRAAEADREVSAERLQSSQVALESCQASLEAWKHQENGEVELHQRPDLVPRALQALRELVPAGHVGDCNRVQQIVVTSVEEVVNTELWKQYTLKMQQFTKAMQCRPECPWVTHLVPDVELLQQVLPHVRLERNANEVLLFHGTTQQNAEHIMRQGFDERLAKRDLYGRGVYLTIDSCKAFQYCGEIADGCIIIARVLLGHPFLAEGPMKNHERPPQVNGRSVHHNSVIVRPGIPNGKGKGKGKQIQVHHEFVVPRGDMQIYPEMIVRFRVA